MYDKINTLVIEDYLSESENEVLRNTAVKYFHNGTLEPNPGGPKRYRKKIYNTPYCNDRILSVADRIVAALHLKDYPVDPYLGWIISYIEPGGFIKEHIDAHEHYQNTTDRHLRCNVLVQSENDSAYPVVGGARIEVKERGLWAFFASEHMHGTGVIRGELPRIVYQFGFTVPNSYAIPSSIEVDDQYALKQQTAGN